MSQAELTMEAAVKKAGEEGTTRYLRQVVKTIEAIDSSERESICRAGEIVAAVIADGGVVHVFGSGHSALVAKEVFVRAGTLTCIHAFGLDPVIGQFERLPGIAEGLLAHEDLRAGEVLILVSQSGINPITVEMATLAKQRGLFTIAITSRAHSESVQSRVAGGQKLFEVADLVIDTHTPVGDASVQMPGSNLRVGPLSTIGGAAAANAIVAAAAFQLAELGREVPVRVSRNTPEGDEYNRPFVQQYGERIAELRRL